MYEKRLKKQNLTQQQRKMGLTKTLITESNATPNVEQPVKLFKISCASIGKIMKPKGLGITGETYLREWYLSKKYHRKKDFFSKYVEKGLSVEYLGIQMLSKHEGVELSKNDEWFENDFMNGFPDVIHDKITDIKSSWSIFTFPFYDKELPNDDYEWQLQGYMDLTGKNVAQIAYCLIDTPQPLIDMELKKLYYQSGGRTEDWQPEQWAELAENYKFNDIPFSDRIRIFEVNRNDEKIERIKERVQICRDYIAANFK